MSRHDNVLAASARARSNLSPGTVRLHEVVAALQAMDVDCVQELIGAKRCKLWPALMIRVHLTAHAASLSGEMAVRHLPEEDALFLDVLVTAVNNPQPKRRTLWPSAGMMEKLREVAMFRWPQPEVSASVANLLLCGSSAICLQGQGKRAQGYC